MGEKMIPYLCCKSNSYSNAHGKQECRKTVEYRPFSPFMSGFDLKADAVSACDHFAANHTLNFLKPAWSPVALTAGLCSSSTSFFSHLGCSLQARAAARQWWLGLIFAIELHKMPSPPAVRNNIVNGIIREHIA